MPFFTVETLSGESIRTGTNTITPFSRAIRLMLLGTRGGLIWNRPVSLLVQGADGSENVLPVVDVTRIAQLALLGIGLAGGILFWLISRR